MGQQCVVPGFETDVEPVQAGLADRPEFLGFPVGEGFRAGIAGHPGQGGKLAPEVLQDRHKLGGPHDEAVGILEEGGLPARASQLKTETKP